MKTVCSYIAAGLALTTACPVTFANVNVELPTENLVTFPDNLVPCVGLPDADGNFSTENLVTMEKTLHGYEVSNVTVGENGFRFYAADTGNSDDSADWTMKWYSLADFGVNPPLEYYLNPLYVLNEYTTNPHITPTPGDYNIYYFDQLDNGQHYNLFALEPADGHGTPEYPAKLFLLDYVNTAIELDEYPGTTGIYASTVTLPEYGFKISYQSQGYYVPGFIFGPVDSSEADLTMNVRCPIDFGVNTAVPFTYEDVQAVSEDTGTETPSQSVARRAGGDGPMRAARAGDQVFVMVDLSGPNNYIMLTDGLPTGFQDLHTDEGQGGEPVYYNLQGSLLDNPAKGTTVVAVYPDGHAGKEVK